MGVRDLDRPIASSFIGLTWLLSLSLDLSVYQGRLLALLLVWHKVQYQQRIAIYAHVFKPHPAREGQQSSGSIL